MADKNTNVNPVNPRESKTISSNDQHTAAEAKSKKGFWSRYTKRLKDTHCTLTPPECR